MKENRSKRAYTKTVTVIIAIALLVTGWLSYLGYRLADSETLNSQSYLSLLTLSVTIIVVGGALLGGGSIWLTLRARDFLAETVKADLGT